MSLKLFQQFLRVEIARQPSLAEALKCKGGLSRCSQLFEEALANLHYWLIRRAVQLLFSRANEARLRQLNAAAPGRTSTEDSCRTGETSYAGTDSTCSATHSRNVSPTCSLHFQCSHLSDNRHTKFDGNAQWDTQSNNSRSFREMQISPRNRGCELDCPSISSNCSSNASRTNGAKKYQKRSVPQNTRPQQCRQTSVQPSITPQSQPVKQHRYQPQSGISAHPSRKLPPQWPPTMTTQAVPPQPEPELREGPSYSYPTVGKHNRQVMTSWYVANMDALLTNLMRLFDKIYTDTLRMCGTSPSALLDFKSALPDPTLLSMQQRAGGDWRPNFMSCKIDFLLHIATMVYRNTQDLRCGCPCPEPADPCAPRTQPAPCRLNQAFPEKQNQRGSQKKKQHQHKAANQSVNRNSATVADLSYEVELDKFSESSKQHICLGQDAQRHSCDARSASESTWTNQCNSSNGRSVLSKISWLRSSQARQQRQKAVYNIEKSFQFETSSRKDARTNSSEGSDSTKTRRTSRAIKPAAAIVREMRCHRQKRPKRYVVVLRSKAFVIKSYSTSESDSSTSATLQPSTDNNATGDAKTADYCSTVDLLH